MRLPSLAALFAFTIPVFAAAQETPEADQLEAAPQTHAQVAPRATAVVTTEAIDIDGRLEEGVWLSAPPITDFTQVDPVEGAPATERTEVRIAYDESAIYVGAKLFDRGEIRTQLARRDGGMGDSDIFEVVFDSYHDHQTAYSFTTNPSGTKRDAIVATNGGDDSWDPVWDVATNVEEGSWTVEMRIPFSQLRFSRDELQTWGIQLERTIHRNQEFVQFAFTPKLERGGVQRYGHLDGIQDIRPGRRLELLPYATARAEYIHQLRPDGIGFDPLRGDSEAYGGVGLDLKYRLSSNLTLDAAVNPDFGQVEVDPAVINLSAFETRYEERRPFFIEGAEIFRFGQGGPTGSTGRPAEVLYSRRIGRSPQGSVPSSAVFEEAPSATTILGAGKLTGKLGGGWSFGVLEAVTASEDAAFLDQAGVRRDILVEPASNYFVGRLRRDVRNGATRFGGIFTAVNRDLSGGPLADRLHTAAYTTGVDLIHEWGQRAWRLSGSFSPSIVFGEPAALVRTQQTSSRYYQRPDATHLSVDSDADYLAGYYAMAELNKLAGTWTGRIGLGATSPGYEVNDIGFQSYADRLILDTHFQYNQTRPGPLFRNWNASGGPDNIWNYAGQHVMSNFNLQGNFQWANYWNSSLRFELTPETYDDRLTRGGPLSRSPTGYLGRINLSTDSRQPFRVSGSVSYFTDEGDSWSQSANLDFNYQAADNWRISAGPSWSRRVASAQYVTSIADPRATSTFGRRYIFAGLDQTTFSIDTRVNVTFTPTLSFEMYAQPFLSSGDYQALRELREPGVYDFLTYGEDVGTISRDADGFWRIDPVGDDPDSAFRVRDLDFTFRSLLGNAVLRWEWRPGSTIYLVWQQSREERLSPLGDPAMGWVGNFDLGRDAGELFGIRPDNVFAIKVNYWLNP